MWGQPKRNVKCVNGHRGQCSCQRRINAEAARRPDAAPHACPRVCQGAGGTCGRTVRGGKCPCPYC